MMYQPIKCGCKKISSAEDMVDLSTETVILGYMSLTMTPNFKTANQSSCITLWLMMMHHHAKLVTKVQQLRRCQSSRWTFPGILNLFYFDLDHNRAIQSFHKTIQLMMMCHQTKFSCKRISSSEDILVSHYLDYMFLKCDLDLENSKQIFLENNLAHNDAPPNQVR